MCEWRHESSRPVELLQQTSRGFARHVAKDYDLPTNALDDASLVLIYGVDCIIAPFHINLGTHGLKKLHGVLLLKNEHRVHALEGRHHERTIVF